MKYIVTKNYEELSRKAADIISAQVIIKPNCVLGLATGSSPVGTYKELINRYREGRLDFSEVSSVNLDEYVGLDGQNPNSYRYFMNTNLFDHININKAHTHVPDGCAPDLKREGKAYDALIRELGGIDIQVLGIGLDGHIGFNEPDRYLTKSTHEVYLDDSTIKANARFFDNNESKVPKSAITMGMMSIMQAKKVLLLANGKAKKEIMEMSFFGPIDPMVPASLLQLHADLTVIYSEE